MVIISNVVVHHHWDDRDADYHCNDVHLYDSCYRTMYECRDTYICMYIDMIHKTT